MFYNRKVTALIPIKSRRKNKVDKTFDIFCSKPLYHYILETFEKTYAIDEIIINTDCEEIIENCPTLFPKVIINKRKKNLLDESIDLNKIIENDIKLHDSDLYIQTHVTNPLLRVDTIVKALRCYIDHEEDYDSLFSVTAHKKRYYNSSGKAINHDINKLIPSNKLEPVYEENSVLYIFTNESFKKRRNRIGSSPYMFEIPSIEAIDINDNITFKLAEIMMLYKQ